MNNYPTQEDRRRFQLIGIIEEQLQDYEKQIENCEYKDKLVSDLAWTLKSVKLDLLKQISHYDFALYMKAVNGKKRSIEICNENIELGLYSFESVLFILNRL